MIMDGRLSGNSRSSWPMAIFTTQQHVSPSADLRYWGSRNGQNNTRSAIDHTGRNQRVGRKGQDSPHKKSNMGNIQDARGDKEASKVKRPIENSGEQRLGWTHRVSCYMAKGHDRAESINSSRCNRS